MKKMHLDYYLHRLLLCLKVLCVCVLFTCLILVTNCNVLWDGNQKPQSYVNIYLSFYFLLLFKSEGNVIVFFLKLVFIIFFFIIIDHHQMVTVWKMENLMCLIDCLFGFLIKFLVQVWFYCFFFANTTFYILSSRLNKTLNLLIQLQHNFPSFYFFPF